MAARFGYLLVVLATMCACLWQAAAAQVTQPLTAADVAEAAARHYPSVLAALAERQGAAGDLLAARGSFDTVFSAEADSRLSGFYDGQYAEAKLERYLNRNGGKVFGSYRASEGGFPIYEDLNFTNKLGELKLGVVFTLLRDRLIDDRRFGVNDASLALRQAELDVLLTRVGVQQQALLAYWRWVQAGKELEVFEDLLRLAEARDVGLREQVRRGARAAIDITESAQNLTRRRVLVEQAKLDLLLAANRLSLYYRSADGNPIVVARERLPNELRPLGVVVTEQLPNILQRRPELAILRTAAERAQQKVLLAENDLKPRLDFKIEASDDFGDIGEGGFSRDESEAIIGLEFEVPLGRRAARGRLARAETELTAIAQRQRLAQDEITAELNEIILSIDAARALVDLAGQEVSQADQMRAAEQRRFVEGASDFFVVNLREEALADARIRLVENLFILNAAAVTYYAAVLDLEQIGLQSAVSF